MKHKSIIFFVTIIVIFYVIRVSNLNDNIYFPNENIYNIGEEVELNEDFFNTSTEISDGYTLKVIDSEIYSIDDFIVKYNVKNNNIKRFDYVYIVKANFKNISNDKIGKAGINLSHYILQETSYITLMENDILSIVNNFDQNSFSLYLNSEKEIMIPFAISKKDIDIERLIDGKLRLVVSLYPNKKVIRLDGPKLIQDKMP